MSRSGTVKCGLPKMDMLPITACHHPSKKISPNSVPITLSSLPLVTNLDDSSLPSPFYPLVSSILDCVLQRVAPSSLESQTLVYF